MSSEKDVVSELLLQELRMLRTDINEMRKELYGEIDSVKKDVNTLKTRFMIIAVTMGLAGGKISSFLPFFR